MIVILDSDRAEVADGDDCGRLSIRTGLAAAAVADALQSTNIGVLHNDADALIDITWLRDNASSGARTDDWDARFAAMLDYAASKGWCSADGQAVQAHIDFT